MLTVKLEKSKQEDFGPITFSDLRSGDAVIDKYGNVRIKERNHYFKVSVCGSIEILSRDSFPTWEKLGLKKLKNVRITVKVEE